MPENQSAQPQTENVLDHYRTSIEDTVDLLEALGPVCSDIDEMISMLKLALKNDSQLTLVLKQVAPVRLRK